MLMPKTPRTNKAIPREIAARFVHSYEVGMGLSTAEVSRCLGYANPTTIQAIRRGETLPDVTRIAENIDKLTNKNGAVLNLHWLITGMGPPFVPKEISGKSGKKKFDIDDDIIMCLMNLNHTQQQAFTKLIQTLR